MYEVLVLFHILSAMVWVGGGFVLVTIQHRDHRVGGPKALAKTMAETRWVDDWIFTPAPLLTVATGIALVATSDAWGFSQPWVYLALTLVLAEFALGYRDYKRLEVARETNPEGPEFNEALRAYLRMTPIAISMLATVVFLMVFKPGL